MCGQVAGDGTTSTETPTAQVHLEYIVAMQGQIVADSMLYSTCTTQQVRLATPTSGPTTQMAIPMISPSPSHPYQETQQTIQVTFGCQQPFSGRIHTGTISHQPADAATDLAAVAVAMSIADGSGEVGVLGGIVIKNAAILAAKHTATVEESWDTPTTPSLEHKE